MINNNDNGEKKIVWYFLRTSIAILVLAASAWAQWVTSSINKHTDLLSEIKTSLARIEQKLADHFQEDSRGRH